MTATARKTKSTVQLSIMPETSTAYDALVAEAERQQLPKHYKGDLTEIDHSVLVAPDAPAFFGWQLRECGTGLYRADVLSLQMAEASAQQWPASHFYIYDAAGLTEVNADRMIALLVEQLDLDALLKDLVAATDRRFIADRQASAYQDAEHWRKASEARQQEQRARDHYEWAQTAKAQYRRL